MPGSIYKAAIPYLFRKIPPSGMAWKQYIKLLSVYFQKNLAPHQWCRTTHWNRFSVCNALCVIPKNIYWTVTSSQLHVSFSMQPWHWIDLEGEGTGREKIYIFTCYHIYVFTFNHAISTKCFTSKKYHLPFPTPNPLSQSNLFLKPALFGAENFQCFFAYLCY